MGEPVLRVDNLCKAFGALKATDGVSLDLRAGEIHALIGPNGAGKSTLIAQLAGTLLPDTGAIWFDGQEITQMPAHGRARAGLARTFQISSLLPEFTPREHLRVVCLCPGRWSFWRRAGGHQDIEDRVSELLDHVGLMDNSDKPVTDLAHGARRRLEVALALAAEPKAFLLDEPMAGMGTEGARDLTQLLDGLRHKAPILLIEHDMDAVFALADRISVLVYGKIIATGSPGEIRENAAVQDAYLGDGS